LSASTADGAGSPRLRVRAAVSGRPQSSISTGLPLLDHLMGLLAEYASLELSLEVQPGATADEVAAAGRALGEALAVQLREAGVRGHGSSAVPADEALAHVALETSGRPLVVSNVDLSEARLGGLGTDVVGEFLQQLAEGAGLTLHVRLIEGRDTEHVLEAIFKALGVALAQASRPRATRKE
jgi:imidazoleglycerol-phosphate dehydratase